MTTPFKNCLHYEGFASEYLGSTVDGSLTGSGRAICTVLSNPSCLDSLKKVIVTLTLQL